MKDNEIIKKVKFVELFEDKIHVTCDKYRQAFSVIVILPYIKDSENYNVQFISYYTRKTDELYFINL